MDSTPPPSYTESVRRAKLARRVSIGFIVGNPSDEQPTEHSPLLPASTSETHTREGYFKPLISKSHWLSVFHLLILNFPFALVTWLFLFLGVLLGTALLLTLPLGVLLWWITLVGSRSLSNAEISLQSRFHGARPPQTAYRVVFSRPAPPPTLSDIEQNTLPQDPTFLQNSYAMFFDQSSYQPLFYFIIIKACIALVLTPLLLVLVPVSIILIIPAPAVLRLVRRIGVWQARIALEGLSE